MIEEGRAFSNQGDKPIASAAVVAAWSPVSDLLALVTADGQMSLHRLNWQRVWAVQPPAAVCVLAWRPDGKVIDQRATFGRRDTLNCSRDVSCQVLAAGTQAGGVELYDVEDGRTMHSLPGQGGVTALAWGVRWPCQPTLIDRHESPPLPVLPPMEDRAERLLAPLPTALSAADDSDPERPGEEGGAGAMLAEWPPNGGLALLAVARGGQLDLCSQGLLPAAHIQLPDATITVLAAVFAPGLASLRLLCSRAKVTGYIILGLRGQHLRATLAPLFGLGVQRCLWLEAGEHLLELAQPKVVRVGALVDLVHRARA